MRATDDERLAALAASALAELGTSAAAVTPARSWLGYFDFALGHDDNVALVDQSSLPATVSASSSLRELLGYASRRFALRVPLRLDLSGYLVRYPDAAEFDQDSWRVDTAFEWSAGAWRIAAGPHVAVTTLDGDGFERSFGAALRATRSLNSRWSLESHFLYDDIDSPTARFDYVKGTRERLRFGLEHRTAGGRVRVGYELESQDRASPSISPERSRIAFNYARYLREHWSIDGTIAHRNSRYDDLLTPRREQLREVTVIARRELPSGWMLNTEYRWANNDADVTQFGYRSRRVGLGVSRSF